MLGSARVFEPNMKNVRFEGMQDRFIPIRYQELLETSLKYFNIAGNQKYTNLSNMLHMYYHKVFSKDLMEIHSLYKPLDPDNEMLSIKKYSVEDYLDLRAKVFHHVDDFMNHANYTKLEKGELYNMLNSESPYVEVNVDFDDFEEIKIYYRGESIESELKRDIKSLFLKKKEVEKKIYTRLFIVIQPKTIEKRAAELSKDGSISYGKAKRKLRRSNPLLTSKKNSNVYIKAFKNIPYTDLKMLFPNGKIKIKSLDKIKIGVLGGGGVIAGTGTLFIEISHLVDPIGMMIALGTYGALLWRQVKEVIFQRTFYMAELAKKLYMHNLGSNESALNYMIKNAEDSESKEALLSYVFLLVNPSIKTKEDLDRSIEDFIEQTYKVHIDFEINDSLSKLEKLGLVKEIDGELKVLDIDSAIKSLDMTMMKL